MQLGFVGLGKMGGNMVHRIHRDSDHECVVFDLDEDAVERGRGPRRHAAPRRSRTWSRSSSRRARSGSWCRRATPTQSTVDELAELLEEGDTIVDGGNSRWTDDKAPPEELQPKGDPLRGRRHERRRLGPQVGYCMMVGGPDEAVERLAPILDVLAPPPRRSTGPAGGTSARPAPATT